MENYTKYALKATDELEALLDALEESGPLFRTMEEQYAILGEGPLLFLVCRTYHQANHGNVDPPEGGDHPLAGGNGACIRRQSGNAGNMGQACSYDQCTDFHDITSPSYIYQTMGMVSNS